MLFEYFCYLFEHLLRLDFWIYVVVFIQFTVVLYYLLCLVLICHKPLLYAFNIVITSSTCFSPLKKSVCHHFLTTLQVKDKWKVYLLVHQLLPFWKVLHVSWESINEEPTSFKSSFVHSFFEKANSNLTRNNFSFLDIAFNDLTVLRPWSFSFFSK